MRLTTASAQCLRRLGALFSFYNVYYLAAVPCWRNNKRITHVVGLRRDNGQRYKPRQLDVRQLHTGRGRRTERRPQS